MAERETLDRRLRAVERTVVDGETDLEAIREAGQLTERVDQVTADLDAVQERLDELEAATQALRGYVGNVRSVNDDVERRADAALAAVDRLEDRLDDPQSRPTTDGDADSLHLPSDDGGHTTNANGTAVAAPRDGATPSDSSPTPSSADGCGTRAATDGGGDDASLLARLRRRL